MLDLKNDRSNSLKVYALLWRSYLEISRNSTNEELQLTLSQLPSKSVLSYLTPFAWNSILATIREWKSNENISNRTRNNSNLLVWDSLFELLPEKSILKLKHEGIKKFILPNLKILDLSIDDRFELQKINGHTLINTKETIRKLEPNEREFVSLDYHAQVRILNHANNSLLDKKSLGSFSKKIELNSWSEILNSTFNLIEVTDSSLYKNIIDEVSWVIPISSQDKNTHNSFTAANIPSAMFLSYTPSVERLADAVVHEYSHLILNKSDLVSPLMKHSNDLFYSPWRNDPRPLIGLFHAVFVFTNVLSFLIRTLNQSEIKLDENYLRMRIDVLIRKISIGLRQVNRERLFDKGKDILDDVSNKFDNIKNEFHLEQKFSSEKSIAKHMNDWKLAHPKLEII